MRDYRRENLKRRYGITPEEADELLELQHGVCAICGSNDQLGIDHEHALEGRASIRGVLCRRCNRDVIPAVEHHETLIKAALDYLLRPPARQVLIGLTDDGAQADLEA